MRTFIQFNQSFQFMQAKRIFDDYGHTVFLNGQSFFLSFIPNMLFWE